MRSVRTCGHYVFRCPAALRAYPRWYFRYRCPLYTLTPIYYRDSKRMVFLYSKGRRCVILYRVGLFPVCVRVCGSALRDPQQRRRELGHSRRADA
jgi:hypothetical protein